MLLSPVRLRVLLLAVCFLSMSCRPVGEAATKTQEAKPQQALPELESKAWPARTIGTLEGAPLYRTEVVSQVHTIDRIFPSMQGPLSVHRFELMPGNESELVWVVGYEASIVGEDGQTEQSQDFMCHSNLSVRPGAGLIYQFPTALQPTAGRLFTLAQGQLEVHMPRGFGVPLLSNQAVQFAAQVLNHNVVGRSFGVRQRIRVDFVRDRDLTTSFRPLVPRAVYGLKLVEGKDGYFGVDQQAVDPKLHGEGCQVGQDVQSPFPSIVNDGQGRKFTGHWVVEPGREENHTPITRLLALPYDTTLHYVAVHLHPFAEFIELRDLTTRKTVWRSRARQAEGRVGLAEVEAFSSEQGIPLYKNHEYEVFSSYNNTSGARQDAMATMFLYLMARDLDVSAFRAGARQGAG